MYYILLNGIYFFLLTVIHVLALLIYINNIQSIIKQLAWGGSKQLLLYCFYIQGVSDGITELRNGIAAKQ